MITYLIICPMVFLAGFIDAIAGGGGLISLPAYMFAGLPVHNAIATNKMSSCMGTTIATAKLGAEGFIPWKKVPFSIFSAIIGSVIGARIALLVSDYYFKMLMLVILPVCAGYVLFRKALEKDKEPYSFLKTTILSSLIAFFIGIYDGFYGPGTGTFLILLLTNLAHVSIHESNGFTKAINLTTNISALTVYVMSGKIIFLLGLTAGCFNIAGNYLGVRYFTKGGAKTTRPVMIFVLILFFIKILAEIL